MFAGKQLIECVVVIAIAIGVVGCGSSSSSNSGSGGGSSMDELAEQVDAQNAVRKQADAEAAAKAAAAQKAADGQAAQTPAEPERKVAGRAPVAPGGGYYSAIIGARRHILNEAESWAWKQGVGSFRAEKGRKPKDNAEFMKLVIDAMQIPLPKKEDNEEYFYDPAGESDGDFGQLYVVEKQPAPNSAPPPTNAPAQK